MIAVIADIATSSPESEAPIPCGVHDCTHRQIVASNEKHFPKKHTSGSDSTGENVSDLGDHAR
ncbi:MAG TPA: hypothetical protein VF532_14265 [Candidatus Angelobacter sp.]